MSYTAEGCAEKEKKEKQWMDLMLHSFVIAAGYAYWMKRPACCKGKCHLRDIQMVTILASITKTRYSLKTMFACHPQSIDKNIGDSVIFVPGLCL